MAHRSFRSWPMPQQHGFKEDYQSIEVQKLKHNAQDLHDFFKGCNRFIDYLRIRIFRYFSSSLLLIIFLTFIQARSLAGELSSFFLAYLWA